MVPYAPVVYTGVALHNALQSRAVLDSAHAAHTAPFLTCKRATVVAWPFDSAPEEQ